MGYWVIHIEGLGGHHGGEENDPVRLARELVERLKKAGQNISSASVHHSSRDDMNPGPKTG